MVWEFLLPGVELYQIRAERKVCGEYSPIVTVKAVDERQYRVDFPWTTAKVSMSAMKQEKRAEGSLYNTYPFLYVTC